MKLSPANWILQRRIEFACHLLRHTNRNISQIAIRTGFRNPHYFSRVFHRVVGSTPRQYRLSYGSHPS
ncbi:MAG: AraC family transcriptional regulator [Lentisphaerae bacterium]|nr:MAG: AraC family transcriptional regulator [Lentisphaerota bacterium]